MLEKPFSICIRNLEVPLREAVVFEDWWSHDGMLSMIPIDGGFSFKAYQQ